MRCGSICYLDFILVIVICGLFSYNLVNMDHAGCNMSGELFPFHAKLNVIVKLMIRCF